jgi:hypothetical protein
MALGSFVIKHLLISSFTAFFPPVLGIQLRPSIYILEVMVALSIIFEVSDIFVDPRNAHRPWAVCLKDKQGAVVSPGRSG